MYADFMHNINGLKVISATQFPPALKCPIDRILLTEMCESVRINLCEVSNIRQIIKFRDDVNA